MFYGNIFAMIQNHDIPSVQTAMGYSETPDLEAFLAAGLTEEQARRAVNKAFDSVVAVFEDESDTGYNRPTLADLTNNEIRHLGELAGQTVARLAAENAVAAVIEDADGTIRQAQGHLVDSAQYARTEPTEPLDFPDWVNQR